jgi:nucleoside-diphosphate-sugar epimerase
MIPFQKIFITGGAGYVGSQLVPQLLKKGLQVTVLDLMIYGAEVLPPHENLTVVKGDIRDQALLRQTLPGHDAVIHLACISNDPSFELNPDLGRSINLTAFRPLVKISQDTGIGRFIYASSSSVYGVKEEPNVNEEMLLGPLTDYSRFKADCEKILNEYNSENFTTVIIRPATVCGYSPRQRLDVVVNILTNLAYHKREITVFGGSQLRPNIHITDMVHAYVTLLEAQTDKISGKVFNVGYENQSVKELAEMVRSVIGSDVRLTVTPTEDNRSYHISSEKMRRELGFVAQHSIREAAEDLVKAFEIGLLPDSLTNERYFNIKRMQNIHLN